MQEKKFFKDRRGAAMLNDALIGLMIMSLSVPTFVTSAATSDATAGRTNVEVARESDMISIVDATLGSAKQVGFSGSEIDVHYRDHAPQIDPETGVERPLEGVRSLEVGSGHVEMSRDIGGVYKLYVWADKVVDPDPNAATVSDSAVRVSAVAPRPGFADANCTPRMEESRECLVHHMVADSSIGGVNLDNLYKKSTDKNELTSVIYESTIQQVNYTGSNLNPPVKTQDGWELYDKATLRYMIQAKSNGGTNPRLRITGVSRKTPDSTGVMHGEWPDGTEMVREIPLRDLKADGSYTYYYGSIDIRYLANIKVEVVDGIVEANTPIFIAVTEAD